MNFDAVHLHPKPLQDRRIPIVIGGNGDAALRRAARTGDGWYGFYLSYDETAERLATLRRFCEEEQRDPATLRTAVALLDVTPDDRPRIEALGLDEVVLVAGPPDKADAVPAWICRVTAGWVAPDLQLGRKGLYGRVFGGHVAVLDEPAAESAIAWRRGARVVGRAFRERAGR